MANSDPVEILNRDNFKKNVAVDNEWPLEVDKLLLNSEDKNSDSDLKIILEIINVKGQRVSGVSLSCYRI